jgi:TonB family protein
MRVPDNRVFNLIRRWPLVSAILGAGLLHGLAFLVWPVDHDEAGDLISSGEVVELVSLDVFVPEPPMRPAVDPNRFAEGPTNTPDPGENPPDGNEYLPFFAADTQPVPLAEIRRILEYPASARSMGIETTVTVELDIDREGTVRAVRIPKEAGWGFDEELRRKLPRIRFRPAFREGKPIGVTVRLPVEFRLR